MSIDMERLLDAVERVESGGNVNAVSPKGAKGPYQFMDGTAAQYGVKDPFNRDQARDGARRYLNDLTKQFGSVELALVAYNGGPGRLARNNNNIRAMPQESQDYLVKVMSHYGDTVADTRTKVNAQFNQFEQPTSPAERLFPGEDAIASRAAGRLFPRNRENDALRQSILDPRPVDKAQRIYEMQLQTGLPVGLIERNLDDLEARVKRENFDPEAFRKESPLLAEWLAANPTRAAIAQGDYENLGALEKTWQVFQAVPLGLEQGAKKERMMMLSYKAAQGTITPQEQIERSKLKTELQDLGSQFEQGLPSWTKAAADIIGMQIPMGLEAISQGVKFGVPAGAIAGGGLGLIGGPGAPVTVTAGAAAGGLMGGKLVAGASYLDQTYRMSVGEAFDELENAKDVDGNPIDPVVARYASLLVAVPNAAMEFASLRMALKVIPGADQVMGRLTSQGMKQILTRPTVTAALKDFSKKYAAAVGTETFTEGMQALNVILARELATGDMGSGLSKGDAESVVEQSVQAFKGTVVLGALASGPKIVETYAQMEKAEQNQQFMQALGEAAQSSSTNAKSPQAFKEYIQHLKENGPVKDVFIPIEKWDSLFQDQAPGAAAEVFGNLKQYAEAKTTGGDLVIPIETYAEKLAGSQFHERLMPDMRLNPGELTATEAQEIQEAEPEIMAGLQTEMDQAIAKEEPLQEIYTDVFRKLRDVGMSRFEANRDAVLWRERLRARAELLGMDPLQLYNEQPLTVQREYPEAVTQQLKKFNQSLVEEPVPFSEKLPLEGGEINLPPATPEESTAAKTTFEAGSTSQEESGVFGATIHPVKGNLAGTEGVAVAGYPQRGVVTEGAPSAADLEVFMRRNRDIFEQDPTAALGVWVDSESGKGYIDITNVLPKEVAIAQGEAMGEKAVWDLSAFEEIRLPVQRDAGQGVLFQGERGASVPTQKMIALLKGADASTFVHESAHLWLEELRMDAMRPDAPEKLKQQWEVIKAWSGAQDDTITTGAHEMFARGFEAHLMEGKAPSVQLREVFAEFANWLMRIYRSMTMLDVTLTDDVRDVMDRMIATDEAIKINRDRNSYDRPLFEAGDMTEAELGAYKQLAEEAKTTAEDNFRAKVMKELRREKTQAWRDEKNAMQPKVRAEILEQPIYRAAYWLWSGTLPNGQTIPDMAATKLDTQALQDLGVDPKDLPFRHQKNGLSPDMVAEMFGFTSGESLVRELVGLPTLKKAIDDEVGRRIREAHGGVIVEGTTMEEAAMEVQNTRQIDVFNMELRILKRLGAKREKTHPAIMKDIARKIVDRKTLRQLNPRVFEEAAIKAGQEAQDAMLGREFRSGTGRNLDVAFDAKQRQLLNLLMFKEATEQRKQADKSVRKWKKFLFRSDKRLAQNYDMNMVGAARAIASVHGLGSSPDTAVNYMRMLEQYDPESFNDMKHIVELASSDGRKLDDLTVSEFHIVRDSIEGLWAMARRAKQVEIDGNKIDRTQVIGELNTRINDLAKPGSRSRAGYDRARTTWDKTKANLMGARAFLRRTEHWVDAMDGGDPNGPFRKYIWQPISEAADAYRDHRRIMLEKYEAITRKFPKESTRMGKINAPEIGYEFGDKAELLAAMLHTGNESNLQKLLVGREWGSLIDGDLNSQKWDKFIARMHDEGVLTKADYDFVQGVWDLFEEMKPEAQQVHKDVYGYFFNEITANPVNTPFGVYRGGYYPAKVDPFLVEDASIREEQEALENGPNSFMFPSPAIGFTKQRSAHYAKPLALEIGLVQQHIQTELKFIHLKRPTKDIGRVVIDKDFRATLAALDSEVGATMLMPWLQRSALQLVETPSGPRMRGLDSFFHAVRTRTGLQFMAANVSVALQQITGLSLAAVKVKPRNLAGALWRYTSSPMQYSAEQKEKSSFMRNRVSTQVMDVQRSIDNILLNPNSLQKARAFANEHGYVLQTAMQSVVDTITWGGAYEQAVENGADEKSAIRQADSAVRETQGTFAPEDISRVEAGSPLIRTFTMFYSFFNMAANLNGTEFTKAMQKQGYSGGGRALYVYAMGFMIPAVLSEAIVQLMSGELTDDDDDDGYLDNLLSVFFGGQARMATAMVPAIGPAVQTGINQFNDKWYDDRINLSPAVSAMEAVGRTPYDVWRQATEDDVRSARTSKDVLTLIGLATGLPTAPLAKPLGYLSDLEQGYIEEPDNPVELTRGLLSGRAPR